MIKSLSHWLAKIEQIHQKSIDLSLDRIQMVANSLNLTDFDCPVIVVGGTNGKGSCVQFLTAILTESGYRVGTYTSPHLQLFSERIRICNEMVDDATLCAAFEVIDTQRKAVPLTFFEFTTLAALWIYQQADLDALVLEVGLGGRLDAVNIVQPDISIVTSIDLDHTDFLGPTREDIGYEKSGIFRQGKVAICGEPEPPYTLREQASLIGARLYQIGRDFGLVQHATTWQWTSRDRTLENLPFPHLPVANAAIALMAISCLQKQLAISNEAIIKGLQIAKLPGRYQVFQEPPCILDVAHNPAAARLLANTLARSGHKNLKAVVGMLADKDIPNTLAPLREYVNEWHVASLQVPRGAKAADLGRYLQDFNIPRWYTYDCVHDAFTAATNHVKTDEKILVFGSFYTVAEVLNLLENARIIAEGTFS